MMQKRPGAFGIAVAVLSLAVSACSNGSAPVSSSGGMLPATQARETLSSMLAPTPLPSTIFLRSGGVDGTDNTFTPYDGDTTTGGRGQTVGTIACSPTMVTNKYHVHLFVGLLVNGAEIAIPDGIGMNMPEGEDSTGFTSYATNCYYSIHTHDASGMIHLEANSSTPLSGTMFTLGNLLAVWGQSISSTAFGKYQGTVTVYVSKVPLQTYYSGPFTQYTGDPRNIQFYSHESIWIQVGTAIPATKLPKIHFYTEY